MNIELKYHQFYQQLLRRIAEVSWMKIYNQLANFQ